MLATTLVAVLVALLLVNAGAALYARIRVARAQTTLDQHWLAAQTATSHLLSTYVDEETGVRGFLLTGNPVFLQPYTRGEVRAADLHHQLAALLAADTTGRTLLRHVVAAYAAWRDRSALPEIAARRAGPLSQAQMNTTVLEGKALFDSLRSQVAGLAGRMTFLIRSALRSSASAQALADVVTAVTVALALLAATLALPATRRILTRPLERLLAQMTRVAGGDYTQAIEPSGAAELVAMARAAEQMRESLLEHSAELVRAQRTLTLRGERDRVAADLHDRSIQRMFGLGLSLSSLAKRHPDLAPTFVRLIDETDRGIRELRGIIFNLSHEGETTVRRGIDEVVRDSARALGFTPELEVLGPVDHVADEALTRELLAVLREGLSNVVRHAQASAVKVTISADGHDLRLVVADDGIGLSGGPRGHGTRNMAARAARLGGSFELRTGVDGVSIEWCVPVAPRPDDRPPGSDGNYPPDP
ncbi:MAG: CHASE3 domain-containing protein [Actinomycetota bacterium]|nr:CHASE3 domain-containing protein [Actinomycetota bacterium]